ncbi:MAG: hypothetical protein V7K92_28405 [Nostoc sp.]|uniref:hypothetical protein n=1 Tax=Nostoc sp. TaxID=1180 RepID=UPI002FEE6EEA
MDAHNIMAVIIGIITIPSAIYKLLMEPSIDAKISNLETKIANLETKTFLMTENSKSILNERITTIDRKVDIHLENYSNYKEANLLHNNGLNEKINHTWNKTKELINSEKAERK